LLAGLLCEQTCEQQFFVVRFCALQAQKRTTMKESSLPSQAHMLPQ
jgi:hypothetical protein